LYVQTLVLVGADERHLHDGLVHTSVHDARIRVRLELIGAGGVTVHGSASVDGASVTVVTGIDGIGAGERVADDCACLWLADLVVRVTGGYGGAFTGGHIAGDVETGRRADALVGVLTGSCAVTVGQPALILGFTGGAVASLAGVDVQHSLVTLSRSLVTISPSTFHGVTAVERLVLTALAEGTSYVLLTGNILRASIDFRARSIGWIARPLCADVRLTSTFLLRETSTLAGASVVVTLVR